MEICDYLAIPSSVAVQYFGVKLHLAFFETVVNSVFYTLLLSVISLLYQRTKARRLRHPAEAPKAPL